MRTGPRRVGLDACNPTPNQVLDLSGRTPCDAGSIAFEANDLFRDFVKRR